MSRAKQTNFENWHKLVLSQDARVCGWVNTMSAIANQTRQELTDELLAVLDC